MDRISLFEEYRLVERSENEVNIAWKGAHLLLFFLAFIFGSFCTFCFHNLMNLFEEKCVLFPKLLSLSSLRHNVIYEFLPEDKEQAGRLPVDFVSTQWVDKSACYLPTYIPLVSGIFGIIWTTMFLMCSTGSRTLTGLQRPWRIIPPVFIFSVAMSALCIYSSSVTHDGLEELCIKLGEVTGSTTCSYAVNVATLAFERRIRGVYQATTLTILSAWLHTSCWILSALLALVRILLAVDFQLVRINVELQGDMEKILESREKQIRTVSPNPTTDMESSSNYSILSPQSSIEIHYRSDDFPIADSIVDDFSKLSTQSDILYFADELPSHHISELSLVPEESYKLARLKAYQAVPKHLQFIVKIVYDFVDNIEYPESPPNFSPLSLSTSTIQLQSEGALIARQFGQETISSKSPLLTDSAQKFESISKQEAEAVAKEIKRHLQERLYRQLIELPLNTDELASTSSSKSPKRGHIAFESSMNITSEMKRALEQKLTRGLKEAEDEPLKAKKKSNLKNIGVQTDKNVNETNIRKQKVTISESKSTFIESQPASPSSSIKSADDKDEKGHDKGTQTSPKEKQD